MRMRAAGFVAVVAAALALGACASAPKVPAGITKEQRAAATEQELTLLWSYTEASRANVPRPVVKVVKFTTYLDVNQVFAECMTRAGYRTVWDARSGLSGPAVGDDDRMQYETAEYICEARYPEDPIELGYMSPGQEEYVYRYWQNSLIPCLRGQGVTVDDLPPGDQYGEGYQSVGPSWNPYANVRETKGNSIAPFIFAKCPPYPGELYGAPASR